MDCEDEIYDLEEQVEELEEEVSDLQTEVDELESQLMAYETNSLDDEYKFKYFNEYKDNFTPWELEVLLKNGRQFLNENPLHK
jgi:predicted  nucleic acid-binding Zn-ribbon protein